MKDIFDQSTIAEFQTRIQQLDVSSSAQWGSMNLYQMLRHCAENDSMLLRQKSFRRLFIGRLFGKLALRANIKDDAPLKQNSPTHPDLKITGEGDAEQEKQRWMALLNHYPMREPADYQDFIHPFFGKMSSQQVSLFAVKHIDHHLRQFGV